MKLSIAIASEKALSSAFVVFRGFEDSILKAAALGYDGIELALKDAKEINSDHLKRLLKLTNLQVSCISTGQVYAETGLMFTEAETTKRTVLKKTFERIIDLASDFGQLVNVGRVRGLIGSEKRMDAEKYFREMIYSLCTYAAHRGVGIVLEPINRYEIDFINSLEEGVVLLKELGIDNLRLMPDIFHMNIEDVQMGTGLLKYMKYIGYIHLADSNRLAPGWGHVDFHEIFDNLKKSGYKGWLSVEILPKPNDYMAAKQAIDYIKLYLHD